MVAKRALKIATIAGILLAGGCAEEQEALVVLRTPAWPDGTCTADPSQDSNSFRGALDVFFSTPFTLPVVLENRMPARTTTNSGVDDNEVQLSDVDVTLSIPQSPDVLSLVAAVNPALVEFNTTVAGVSMSPGDQLGVLVDVITAPAAAALDDAMAQVFPNQDVRLTVEAEVVFNALRSGNTAGSIGVIEARSYTYPIEICSGCLLRCRTCLPQMTCPDDPNATMAYLGGICGNAQDAEIFPAICGIDEG